MADKHTLADPYCDGNHAPNRDSCPIHRDTHPTDRYARANPNSTGDKYTCAADAHPADCNTGSTNQHAQPSTPTDQHIATATAHQHSPAAGSQVEL